MAYNSHSNDYFKDGKLLKLEEVFKSYSCSQIFQALNYESHFLSSHLKTHLQVSNLSTRNSSNLVLPQCRKAQTKAGFMFTAINEWNSLPPMVKSANNLSSFKSRNIHETRVTRHQINDRQLIFPQKTFNPTSGSIWPG